MAERIRAVPRFRFYWHTRRQLPDAPELLFVQTRLQVGDVLYPDEPFTCDPVQLHLVWLGLGRLFLVDPDERPTLPVPMVLNASPLDATWLEAEVSAGPGDLLRLDIGPGTATGQTDLVCEVSAPDLVRSLLDTAQEALDGFAEIGVPAAEADIDQLRRRMSEVEGWLPVDGDG